MDKTKYGRYPLIFPTPLVLAGAMVHGKPNYEPLGDCGIMNINPAVVYISSRKSHYTNNGILKSKVFSINIPSVDMMEKVDYCGLVSGNKTDKSQLFTTFFGTKDNIPLIDECPVNIACKVIKRIKVFNMDVFIGEIIETFVGEGYITNGCVDIEKINPLIYCIDNFYWTIGNKLGKGFETGKLLQSK